MGSIRKVWAALTARSAVNLTVNLIGAPVGTQVRHEGSTKDGNLRVDVIFDERVAKAMGGPSLGTLAAMRAGFSLARR